MYRQLEGQPSPPSPPYKYDAKANEQCPNGEVDITYFINPENGEFFGSRFVPSEKILAVIERLKENPDDIEAQAEHYFYQRYDIAGRASNGLKMEIMGGDYLPGPFGEVFYDAYGDPKISDHAHTHLRRHSAWTKLLLTHIPELPFQEGFDDYLDASMLVSDFHDLDQILNQHRIFEEGITGVSPRDGHEVGAAMMILAMYRKYAVARFGSDTPEHLEKSWNICTKAAVMMMKHDSQESLDELFTEKEPIDTSTFTDDELIRAFNSNQLDLTQITSLELFRILTIQKKKYQTNGSHTGLHPAFEQEYGSELNSELLEVLIDKGNKPLMKNATENDRVNLTLSADILYRADLWDMTTPPMNALLRTLAGGHSPHRRFIPEFGSLEDVDTFLNVIFQQPLTLPADFKQFETDVRRSSAERKDVMPRYSLVGNNEIVRRINRESSIMGALALADLGRAVLKGEASYTNFLDAHYAQRTRAILLKAARKANLGDITGLTEHEVKALLSNNNYDNYAIMYEQKKAGLQEEKNRILLNLQSEKKNCTEPANPDQHFYFEYFIAQYIRGLLQQYRMSEKEFKKIQKRYRKGENPQDQPYTFYADLASMGNMRRLFR